jgi:hypothetical protein
LTQRVLDFVQRSTQSPVVLIQKDHGRSFGTRIGQRQSGGRGYGILFVLSNPVPPIHGRAALLHQHALDRCHRRVSAVAMHFYPIVRPKAKNHLFRASGAELDPPEDKPILPDSSQRLAALGPEPRPDRVFGFWSCDQERRHRPPPWRCQSD